MPVPTTTADLVTLIRRSRLLADDQLDPYAAAATPAELAEKLKGDGLLTPFQADQLLRGRHKGFILGKYRLLDRIGLGGMGQVYLAEHLSMRRRVAVKVLPPDRSGSVFARERFLREARAAAAVEHPNLVRVFDVENDGDVYFLVMEYLDGVTLHDLVARRGPLAADRAAYYTAQAAAGLSALHARALVHRDVKPANLLLTRDGTVKVLDLGLVRSELDDDELTRQEGAKIVGTADFLAPEQALHCSKVDARADVYGLGGSAYFLLTGQPPFPVEKLSQKLIAHQVQDARPVRQIRPDVPAALAAVIHKMLEKKPDDRPQSAADVVAALGPWLACPAQIPDPADFPDRAAVGAPASMAMSFAHRVGGGSSLALAGFRSAVRPTIGGAGGSAIRFGSDPGKPGLAGQPTAAVAADETGVNHPSPAPSDATPKPYMVTLAELSSRLPRSHGPAPQPIDLELAPPPAPRGLVATVCGWLAGLFGSR